MSDTATAASTVSEAADLARMDARLAALRHLLPATNEPLRLAARRLRWFRAAFHAHLRGVERETSVRFVVDDTALAAVFVDWLRAIAVQRPDVQRSADTPLREAFFDFSAGLALRELCRHLPLRCVARPDALNPNSPEGFWPEGYAITTFALSLLTAAHEQEFAAPTKLSPLILDLRSWWSFRENARRDPSFATGFLQALIGQDPNWQFPDVFRAQGFASGGPH